MAFRYSRERVLKPGGLNIYTVRHIADPHYRTGIHRGDDMREIAGGFIVHFFDRAKVERLATGYEIVSLEEFEETDPSEEALSRHAKEKAVSHLVRTTVEPTLPLPIVEVLTQFD